ncbi:MAG: hypothetical protein KF688_16425 [Pirellulales bacterium]|nr:hypothetical protein [Pirellulales bacterium]
MPAADALLAAAVGAAADELVAEVDRAGWPIERALGLLASLSAEIAGQRELVEVAARRLGPIAGDRIARMAGALADLEAALVAHAPELESELKLRLRPLREQWEARGPGMLLHVARQTEEQLIPASAEGVLTAPYTGGFGLAHASTNRFLLEAVLVNPLPELPEAVRIAWLVCHLNAELPRYAEATSTLPAAERIVPLAALPAALAAAEYVELAACNEATVAAALEAWRVPGASPALAATLWRWWSLYLDGATSWPAATAALEQMLAPGE